MTSSFETLPVEIILHIHLLSTSSTLPLVSRYIHSCIRSSSTPSYRAQWLLYRLAREGYAPATARTVATSTSTATHRHTPQRSRSASRRHGLSSAANRVTSSGCRQEDARNGSIIHANTKDADAQFLNKALRFPICNLDTVLLLEKKCLDNLNERTQARYKEAQLVKLAKTRIGRPVIAGGRGSSSSSGRVIAAVRSANTSRSTGGVIEEASSSSPPPPYPTFLPLPPRSIDIPKRLFRNLTSSPSPSSSISPSMNASTPITSSSSPSTTFESEDLPLLLHILTHLQGNPNSNKGYALAKSVLSRCRPLVEVLLEHGADPSIKDYMAVMLAVGRRDLDIVKLLIERQDDSFSFPSSSSSDKSLALGAIQSISMPTSGGNGSKKRRRGGGGDNERISPKRRKLDDRIQVTSEMLELAVKLEYEPLIQFFMSKGAVPNLKTLQMLQA